MEGNWNRHDFAQAQAARSVPKLDATSQKLLFPLDLLRESGRAVKLEVDNGSDQIEA